MSALPLASARLSKLRISYLKHLLDVDSCKKKYAISTIFSFFLVLNYDFIIHIYFIGIVPLNTATDNVSN